MQRMFRQTDQIDRQNGWLVGWSVGWNRVRALRGKEKNKKSKVFAVDRSIDISHSHPTPIPSEKVCPSPHPHYPSHPIRSDHPPTIPIHRLEKAPRTFNFSNACKWLLVLMRFDLKRQLVPFLVHARTDRQTDRSVSCLRKLFVWQRVCVAEVVFFLPSCERSGFCYIFFF